MVNALVYTLKRPGI